MAVVYWSTVSGCWGGRSLTPRRPKGSHGSAHRWIARYDLQGEAGLHGRAATSAAKNKREPIGYDYVHAAVDDYSRLAHVEIHDDEKGPTCAGFLTRAAAFFTSCLHGSHRSPIRRCCSRSPRNSQNYCCRSSSRSCQSVPPSRDRSRTG